VKVQLRAIPGSPLADSPWKAAATTSGGANAHSIPVEPPSVAAAVVVTTTVVVGAAAPSAVVAAASISVVVVGVAAGKDVAVVPPSPPHETTADVTAITRSQVLARISPPISPTETIRSWS
jgi:hypothetical protein